jgi:hypothetical protein
LEGVEAQFFGASVLQHKVTSTVAAMAHEDMAALREALLAQLARYETEHVQETVHEAEEKNWKSDPSPSALCCGLFSRLSSALDRQSVHC